MSQNKMKIAVITGASSGIGAAFARAVDREMPEIDEIWLLARRREPLERLARELPRAKGVACQVDLANPDEIARFADRLNSSGKELALLINNAGFGKSGSFTRGSLAEQLGMIDVNVRALTDLTWRALPLMAPGSAIVQVASSIAYIPAPNFAVYAASKAYVLSFAEALGFELKPRGIRVLAVCPGPVRTEFFEVAGMSEGRPGQDARQASAMSRAMAEPDDVAALALDDLKRGKTVSIYGLPIKAFAWAAPFVPRALAMKAIASRRDDS